MVSIEDLKGWNGTFNHLARGNQTLKPDDRQKLDLEFPRRPGMFDYLLQTHSDTILSMYTAQMPELQRILSAEDLLGSDWTGDKASSVQMQNMLFPNTGHEFRIGSLSHLSQSV